MKSYIYFIGGKKILEKEGGKDASAKFDQFHKKEVLQQYANLCIGSVAAAPAAAAKPFRTARKTAADQNMFGEQTPYGDPMVCIFSYIIIISYSGIKACLLPFTMKAMSNSVLLAVNLSTRKSWYVENYTNMIFCSLMLLNGTKPKKFHKIWFANLLKLACCPSFVANGPWNTFPKSNQLVV